MCGHTECVCPEMKPEGASVAGGSLEESRETVGREGPGPDA